MRFQMRKMSPDLRFLGIVFLIVAALGVQTLASLSHEDAVPAAHVAAPAVATGDSRQPASLPSTAMKPGSALASGDVFDIDCKKNDAAFEVSAGQVRLRGKTCFNGENLDRVEILNVTNGSTATILRRGTNAFETDLIPLNDGANRLKIASLDPTGHRVERIFNVVSTTKSPR